MLPTLIDTVILVLLIGTLGYGFVLDRRVRALMAALKEMQPMVGAFSSAVDRSELSVKALREIDAARIEPPLRGDPKAAASRPAGRRAPAAEAPPAPEGTEPPGAFEGPAAAPVRGTARAPGKSDLVKTFFDVTKERR